MHDVTRDVVAITIALPLRYQHASPTRQLWPYYMSAVQHDPLTRSTPAHLLLLTYLIITLFVCIFVIMCASLFTKKRAAITTTQKK